MGEISKLIIKGFLDEGFSTETDEFIATINPEDITMSNGTDYASTIPPDASKGFPYYLVTPRVLQFNLFFDASGVIPGSDATTSVQGQVNLLEKTTCSIQSKTGEPNYLRIIWGKIDFKGRLVDLELTYKRFALDGTLISAMAALNILEWNQF